MRRRLSRLVPAAIASAALLVAACSAGPSSIQPRNGGTIHVALPSMPQTLNPLVSRDVVSERAYTPLFPLLYAAQPDLSVGPQLAAGSPVFAAGGRTITVALRTDAHWSDGTAMTAQDVVYTVTTEMDPRLDATAPFDWSPLQSVTAIDAHTVRFTLSVPDAAFIADRLVTPIVPEHVLHTVDPAHMAQAQYSTAPTVTGGPFRYAHRDASSITLDANPTFFLGRPHADHVVEQVLGNDSSAPGLLGEGSLSFDPQLTPDAAAQAVISSGVTVQSFADTSVTAVVFNLRGGRPFAALPLRQAFADSIDHDTLVAQVTGSANDVPVWGDINPASWAFSSGAAQQRPRNTAAAAGLLHNQHPLAQLLFPSSDALLSSAAAMLVQQANAAGFALSLRGMDANSYSAALQQGDFDLALVSAPTALDPDASALYGPGNPEGYDDPAVTSLLASELGATAPSLATLQQERRPIFTHVEQLVSADLPCYFLWSPRHAMGFGATLAGVAAASVQLDRDRDNTFYLNWFLTS